MKKRSTRDIPLTRLDELKALDTFWLKRVFPPPSSDHHAPTEGCGLRRAAHTAWLIATIPVWGPAQGAEKSKPEELIEAGYPERGCEHAS